MVRFVFFIISLIQLYTFSARSQPGVIAPGAYAGKEFSAADCFVSTKYTGKQFRDSLRANYVATGQRIWRVISLEDLDNKTLFNTNKGCIQVGLFEVMKFGMLEKGLNAFNSDDFAAAERNRLTREQKLNAIKFRDSSEVVTFDADGNETKQIVDINRYYLGSDIKCFLIKEDWIFNSHSGKTEKYIIAIAPLVENTKTDKLHPLFWLYYPEWKEMFACFSSKSVYYDEALTYSEVFARRKFSSTITKESNIYDRSVRAIHHGADIQQNTELIKEKLNQREGDHFEH